MVTFSGGPAEGQTLALHRAPVLLRVVRSAAGKIDALDQLSDKPATDEEIFVYRRQGEATQVHLNRSRKAGGCGWFEMAHYKILPEQPTDAQVRETAAWQSWCEEIWVREGGES